MKNIINPILIIVFAVIFRLLPHPPNFAPISAMALFGGVYLNKRYALLIPLVALFISDLFLGLHKTMPFVYGSFFLTGAIGLWLRNNKNMKFILTGTLLSSVLFFVITNFGVWLVGGIYPKNATGLLECFTLAIPFFRNTILGDLFFTGVFFGSYEGALLLAQKYVKSVQRRGS